MANWKSHKTITQSLDFLTAFQPSGADLKNTQVVLFPPFLALASMVQRTRVTGSLIQLGAQNLSAHNEGAHTGEIAAAMLKDVGLSHVLIGHSERRKDQNENGPLLAQKMARALEHGLTPVLCIGEQLEERQNHRTDAILRQQLEDALKPLDLSPSDSFVVAYEPVWAIGTGLIPSMEQLRDTAHSIRGILARVLAHSSANQRGQEQRWAERVPLLYGGSVKRGNAAEIMSLTEFQGLLIGGASLDPVHLQDILHAIATERAT